MPVCRSNERTKSNHNDNGQGEIMMATVGPQQMQLSAGFARPTSLDLQTPEEWTAWRQSFVCCRRVSRLAEQDGAAQVDALSYCHGRDAEDNLAASTLTK
ncbi:hypothetical protein MRX96_009355 [Rhipicephalus microplus]